MLADSLAPETVRPLRRNEYDQLVAMGCFEGERVELLQGMVVEMSPQNAPHAYVIQRLTDIFVEALHGRFQVRCQLPLAMSEVDEPEPDLAVVPRGDYRAAHPDTALLVIEVAGSSLHKDRGVKASIYAAAGVPEYWVIDLTRGTVEAATEPVDGRYTALRTAKAEDRLSPAPLAPLAVALEDFLP